MAVKSLPLCCKLASLRKKHFELIPRISIHPHWDQISNTSPTVITSARDNRDKQAIKNTSEKRKSTQIRGFAELAHVPRVVPATSAVETRLSASSFYVHIQSKSIHRIHSQERTAREGGETVTACYVVQTGGDCSLAVGLGLLEGF